MGELQSLADASGGSLPSTIVARTPSPAPIPATMHRPEPIRIQHNTTHRLDEGRSSFRVPSPRGAPLRSSNRDPQEEDFQRNFGQPSLQVPGANVVGGSSFSPFSPAVAPAPMPSYNQRVSLAMMSADGRGSAVGGSGSYERERAMMMDAYAASMGNDLQHQQQQQRQTRGVPMDLYQQQQHVQQQQQQAIYDQLGVDFSPHLLSESQQQLQSQLQMQIQMQTQPYDTGTGFQQQHRHVNSFGGMSPVGSMPDETMYSSYSEDAAFDEGNSRPRSYGGESTMNMMRVPSYRRDYGGRPSPSSSNWQQQGRQ